MLHVLHGNLVMVICKNTCIIYGNVGGKREMNMHIKFEMKYFRGNTISINDLTKMFILYHLAQL